MGSLACGILSHNLCTKLAELFGKGSEKQAAPAAERELSTRRSFHRPRLVGQARGTLLDAAADVAYGNIDHFTVAELDELPLDLAQLLIDKLIYAGKLTDPLLAKFAVHQLAVLQLSGCPGVADAWLARTDNFKLQRLALANCTLVGDEGLRHLRQQTLLRELDLTGCTSVTAAGLAHLAGLRRLQDLCLSGCESLTGEGLAHIAGLTALTSLNLEKLQGVQTLTALRGISRLQRLNLGWCSHLRAESLQWTMPRMSQMRELCLSRCKVTDAVVAALRACPGMQRLELAGCDKLTDACIPHIVALKHLRRLSLERCILTDTGFEQLKLATTLQHLDLAYTSVSAAAMLAWKPLINLRTLILDSCTAVHDGAMVLFKHLKLVEHLDLSDTLVTNNGLVHLEALKHIRCINLSYAGGPHSISDCGTARLSRLTSLESLSLDMRSIGDGGVRNLSGLTNLRHLDLFGAKVSDAGCAWLRSLTSLESLEICGGAITDKGVAHMSVLQNLRHLSLAQNSRISDTSLMVLSNLGALTFLNLSQSRLTGNGIQHLQSLQKLEALVITNTRVRRPAAERLQATLPNLQLLEC